MTDRYLRLTIMNAEIGVDDDGLSGVLQFQTTAPESRVLDLVLTRFQLERLLDRIKTELAARPKPSRGGSK